MKTIRAALKKARQDAGLTQQAMANELGISCRAYQDIEAGIYEGKIKHWDKLEDLFGIHQQKLRELFPVANKKINGDTE